MSQQSRIVFFYKMKWRLLIALVGLVILPLMLVFFANYNNSEKNLLKKTNQNILYSLLQLENTLNATMVNLMLASQLTIEYISNIDLQKNSYASNIVTMNDIFNKIGLLVPNTNFEITYLPIMGTLFSTLPNSSFNIDEITSSSWYYDALNSKGYFQWKFLDNSYRKSDSQDRKYLSLIRYIPDGTRNETAGVLVLSISTDELTNIIHSNVNPEDFILIGNADFTSLITIGNIPFPDQAGNTKYSEFFGRDESIIISRGGKKWIVQSITIYPAQWHISRIRNFYDVIRDITTMRANTYLMGGISFLIFLLIAYAIINSTTLPISKIVTDMKNVEEGILSTRTSVKGSSEISEISYGFNSMMNRIEKLIAEGEEKQRLIIQEEQQKNIYKLKMLQSQVNPHFLFNVLNDIRWMAIVNKSDNIAAMIMSLGRLLEASLGKKGDFVTIAEELKYLKAYISIQHARYGNKFHVTYEVDESINHVIIPKLVLQPLVENSIIHGLFAKKSGGVINITIFKHIDEVILRVDDNGSGFDNETQSFLKEKHEKTKYSLSHLGIMGTDERIKLLLGRNYGLTISSKINEGTKAEINIPVRYMSND